MHGYIGKHIRKANLIAHINVDRGLTPSAKSLRLPLVLPFELIAPQFHHFDCMVSRNLGERWNRYSKNPGYSHFSPHETDMAT